MNIKNLGNIIVNNYLLTLSNGYMLIDTGYSNGFKHFQKEIRKSNIDIKEIKYIFLTHAHDDHAGFLNELLYVNEDIKIILHPNAVAALRRGQNSFDGGASGAFAYIFCKAMVLVGKGKHRFPSIKKEYEKNYIFIGTSEAKGIEQEYSMKFIETIGHTNCSISLLYDDVLFCGDAAMNNLPSMKHITIWIENRDDFYNSWKKILSLTPKMIYPGHGRPFFSAELHQYLSCVRHVNIYSLK